MACPAPELSPPSSSMRALLCLVAVGVYLGAAACSPETSRTAAADAPAKRERLAPMRPFGAKLPAAVEARLEQLKTIAESGDYHALARLAQANPAFRSNTGGMSHIDYWRLKTSAGDDPTEHLARILAYPPAATAAAEGETYVWPWLAALRGADMTAETAHDIDALLGAGQAEAIRRGAPWSGYSLAIRADGVWLYFTSGAG